MKLAEISQSTWGKVAIGLALFLAGYYFPMFGLLGSAKAPAAPTMSPAGSQAQR
jgi:hypothetical protein